MIEIVAEDVPVEAMLLPPETLTPRPSSPVPAVPVIWILPLAAVETVLPLIVTPWLELPPGEPVPVIRTEPLPSERTVAPLRSSTPGLLALEPATPVMLTFPAPSVSIVAEVVTWTPSALPDPAPLPEIEITPPFACMSVLLTWTPGRNPVPDGFALPRIVMLPAPETRLALNSCTPMLFVLAVPNAMFEPDPPSTMLPPFVRMLAVFAPPPMLMPPTWLPSLSAVNVTFSAPLPVARTLAPAPIVIDSFAVSVKLRVGVLL